MHAVVEAHGGTIALDDSPAGGLRIVIEVPVSQNPNDSNSDA
jgi:signal transduction histidine kinase